MRIDDPSDDIRDVKETLHKEIEEVKQTDSTIKKDIQDVRDELKKQKLTERRYFWAGVIISILGAVGLTVLLHFFRIL